MECRVTLCLSDYCGHQSVEFSIIWKMKYEKLEGVIPEYIDISVGCLHQVSNSSYSASCRLNSLLVQRHHSSRVSDARVIWRTLLPGHSDGFAVLIRRCIRHQVAAIGASVCLPNRTMAGSTPPSCNHNVCLFPFFSDGGSANVQTGALFQNSEKCRFIASARCA